MKKKVLFFIDTLGYGGAERVLVNLVNNMNKDKFDVTLMTLFDYGVNKQSLDKSIKYYSVFNKVFRGNVLLCKMFGRKFLYHMLIKDRYDILVSFLEGNTTRILSGCTQDHVKKLAWIHVEMSPKTLFYCYRSKKEAISVYNSFDKIVGVSQTVVDSFENNIGITDKSAVLYNVVDSDFILEKAMEEQPCRYDKNCMNLVSVGRLIEQKAYGRLLSIHKRLIDDGYHVKLYILGTGEQETMLKKYISDNKLENSAFLMGFTENPYCYVKNADLFVCSSHREGYSTAVTESLIVGTPVVTTLCSGMKEMLGENEYGLITDNNEEALYMGIKDLLDHKEKLEYYKEKAIERGKYFNKETTVKKVEDFLESL